VGGEELLSAGAPPALPARGPTLGRCASSSFRTVTAIPDHTKANGVPAAAPGRAHNLDVSCMGRAVPRHGPFGRGWPAAPGPFRTTRFWAVGSSNDGHFSLHVVGARWGQPEWTSIQLQWRGKQS